VAAAAPKYRIGPSDFFTPGDLAADAQTLNGQVDELDTQIEGNTDVDQSLVDQWTAFHAEWKGFFADEFGGFFRNLFTSLNDANRDQLIQYETIFNNFYAQLQQYNVGLSGGAVVPSDGSGDTLGEQVNNQLKDLPSPTATATSIVAIIVVAVVAYLIWKRA
jgi:hypothetical protein